MLSSSQDEGQAKLERVSLSPGDYPGSQPSPSDVARAEELRQDGNTAYAEGRFEEAVQLYSASALLNPSDHLVYSNRSACWLRMGRPIEALDDADLCVMLVPTFARGFLRKGTAEQLLNRRVDAQTSFKKGLGFDSESSALLQALRGLRAETGGGLQATLYHVLFVSPHLGMDRLFQALEDPDRLTASYVEQRKAELDAQFECLTQTLRVDVSLLLASPVLRDAYDRVTFACGQLLQWAPEAVSKHLAQARHIVEGLGLALRCGWGIHHGVAKFSANALTILATSEGACDELRREAVRLLLGGMMRWLLDPTPEPENPPEDRDVCGCTFLSPRLSAATWLERLFEHGTRPWVREECEKFPGVVSLVVHLCLVVRDERAVPLGLPCLLRLPAVAKAAMECQAVIDLSTCNRDPTGRRDGRRWRERQRGKGTSGAGGAAAASAAAGSSTGPHTALDGDLGDGDADGAGARAGDALGGAAAGAAEADAAAKAVSGPDPDFIPLPFAAAGLGNVAPGPAEKGDEANLGVATVGAGAHLGAPSQRLGEWLMASLGYLLVFVDDDALFAAHACSALHRMALATPDGVTRLATGVWAGLPMLERLSILACQHTAALELLESLARRSPQACGAMRSLAAALASASDLGPEQEAAARAAQGGAPALGAPDAAAAKVAVEDGEPAAPAASAAAPSDAAPGPPEGSAGAQGAAPGKGAQPDSEQADAADAPERTERQRSQSMESSSTAGERGGPRGGGTRERETEREPRENDGLGEPSWVECYQELHDELWADVGKESWDDMPPLRHVASLQMETWAREHGSSSSSSSSSSSAAPMQMRGGPGLVVLGNFLDTAMQVPVAGRLALFAASGALGNLSLEIPAVPATWNPRFMDAVSARLAADETHEIGTPEWHTSLAVAEAREGQESGGKDDVVILLLRSMIQRSPATPDWAAAVWLCAEAGARAAIVVNDLADDGPSRPAFRMGLFGSPAPPIPAFMLGGQDGDSVLEALHRAADVSEALHVAAQSVQSVGASLAPAGTPEAEAEVAPPLWPLVLRVPQDVAQAWSLVETVHRAAPSPGLAAALAALTGRMGLAEKRVWLTRRLQRHHRGDTDADEPAELQLAFVECDRDGPQLPQLRKQLAERTGIAAPDVTGELEVRFREESSVGSAVVREWMDILAQKAFLPTGHHLLVSYDGGATFLPDPSAPFVNPHWRGDFELLGRLLGLALLHQVTLDLPVHPYACELLLQAGAEFELDEDPRASGCAALTPPSLAQDMAKLELIDPELYKHKVQWILANDLAELGFELPFTDVLVACGRPEAPAPVEAAAAHGRVSQSAADGAADGAEEPRKEPEPPLPPLPPLPEVVSPSDALPGDEAASSQVRFRPCPKDTQVALVPDGENLTVTEANKEEFVCALLDWRLRASLQGPIDAMLKGLRCAVPSPVLAEMQRVLGPQEVHGLIAGCRDIDVDDWERNTRMAGGLSTGNREVRWFWRSVRAWASDGRQDRLQDLLQFATGSRRVPVGGFAQLVGFNGSRHLFTLSRGSHLSAGSLPTSHACICTLDLPPWETEKAAQHKLLSAIEAGRARFDEGTAAGPAAEPARPGPGQDAEVPTAEG